MKAGLCGEDYSRFLRPRACRTKTARGPGSLGGPATGSNNRRPEDREEGSQLIWQIIASRCKQGGSICLRGGSGARGRMEASGGRSNRASSGQGCRRSSTAEGGYQRGRRGISIPGKATGSDSFSLAPDAFTVLSREILRSNLSPS